MLSAKFPIGTKFTTRGKFPHDCTVVDILRTYNAKNDLVSIRYVATHLFAGQPVTDSNVPETTIAMGLQSPKVKLECQMIDGCTNPVTHIGEKGYIYCTSCAPCRHGYERVRRMRDWEIRLLESGKPVPSYEPINKPEYA